MVIECISEWSGPQGSGLRTIMYFADGSGLVPSIRSGVNDLWDALKGNFTAAYTVRVSPECRILNTATGVLEDVESDTASYSVTGTGSGNSAADATQALIRWTTGTIVAGRRLQGRTFLPGTPTSSVSNGNLAGFAVSGINGAVAAWLADPTKSGGFSVWHRPKAGGGGSASAVVGGTVWGEFAVLRRRRG